VPKNLVRSNPRQEQLLGRFIFLGNDVGAAEDMVADIDGLQSGNGVDSVTVGVGRLFGLRGNDGILGFKVVQHTCFDKVHGSRC